ncbi:MAG: methionyl-tRNA formyltransferase [Dehalococcoidia bacterium]|nr:methionyl-tRNA formyltransferase [Dehalococcoidia bacterium]
MAQRIVYMGTPEFGVPILELLVAGGHEVVAVYTRPDRPSGRGRQVVASPVKQAALDYGLRVIEPETMRGSAAVALLAGLRPDVVVVAAFSYLLPPDVLATPRLGCLNVHPSLLPRHRGPSPVAAALLQGDSETGVSIMLMNEGLDTGPVLSQERVTIREIDTTGSLTLLLSSLGSHLLSRTLDQWIRGEITPEPQDDSRATYSELIHAKDGIMDWTRSADSLWRRVRAYHPWPGCHTTWKGKRLKIQSGMALPSVSGEDVGKVVELDASFPRGIGVVTGEGVLALDRIQMEGKREVSAEEFVRGHSDFVGSHLGTE